MATVGVDAGAAPGGAGEGDPMALCVKHVGRAARSDGVWLPAGRQAGVKIEGHMQHLHDVKRAEIHSN